MLNLTTLVPCNDTPIEDPQLPSDPVMDQIFDNLSPFNNNAITNVPEATELFPSDPLMDQIFDNLNASTNGQAGSSEQQTLIFGNPVPITTLPPPQYNCSNCHVLGEIIHTNGFNTMKLEVHGRNGMISHAVLEKFDIGENDPHHHHEMLDLCYDDINGVKSFLLQYCEERNREDYIMVGDSLLNTPEGLSVALGGFRLMNQAHPMTPPMSHPTRVTRGSTSAPTRVTRASTSASTRVTTGSSSTKKEKMADVTLKDLVQYFRMTQIDAAKKFGVGLTTFKIKCRKCGIVRWPSRKINSIDRRILIARRRLNSNNPQVRADAKDEIQACQRELAECFNV